MRALLPAVVLLAACNEPPGLTLEVIPLDSKIEYVEVYLADHCEGCPGAMTPPMMSSHSANIYQTDYPQVFSASKSEPEKWKNGHAFFRITSQDTTDGLLPYIMLIGFDANKTPIAINRFSGLTIPASGSEYWQVELDEPVTPLTDAPSNEERIAIWGMNRTGPRCVLVVNADGRADGIVPVDDPDCDGQTAHECSPYIPNATRVATDIDHASCVLPVPAAGTANTTGICLLGGPPCTDGMAATGCDVLDVDYCVPMKACQSCAFGDWSCVTGKLSNPDQTMIGVPFMNCGMATNQDGTECTDPTKRITQLDAGALLAMGSGGTKCTSISMHELTVPLGPFVNKLDVAGGTLELLGFEEPCKIDIQWSGNLQRLLGPQTLLLDLALDNGKHLVLPFVFHGTDACTNGSTCTMSPIDTAESMTLCAKQTTDSTTCAASTACAAGGGVGVACGARCCGAGESCVDGQCRCGDGPPCTEQTHCVASSPTTPPGNSCGSMCTP